MSVYVHCKTHRKRSDIEMNETLNLHRQRTKWTADIELDKKHLVRVQLAQKGGLEKKFFENFVLVRFLFIVKLYVRCPLCSLSM